LVLQLLEPFELVDLHAVVPGLPVVVRGVADAVLAAQVDDLGTAVGFLQHSDDLFTALATVAIAFLTWVLSRIARRQLNIYNRQTNIIHEQTDISKQQATIAGEQ